MSKSAAPRYDKRARTWWFVIDADTVEGRRKQIRRRGFPTKTAAQEELDRIRVKIHDRVYVAPKRQSFRAFIEDDWLPAERMNLEESTWASYARYLRLHVLPVLGDLQLSALDPGHLDRLYAALLEDGRRDGKGGGLSPRTVRYVSTIIGKALKDAVGWDRIVRNPADRAKPPRNREAKAPPMKTWSAEQLEQFLRLAEGNRYQPAWLLIATTGMRRGEALGLQWENIDLDAGTVAVRRTITAIDHRVKVGGQTKTGKARVVELDAHTIAALRGLRARQAQERLMVGAGYQDDGLVFCHPDGRPYHPERFSREFDRMVERHKLERIRLHDLRHTWATLALKAGIDVRIVAERLGHTTTAITQNIYQHVLPGMQANAAEKVSAMIFKRNVQ